MADGQIDDAVIADHEPDAAAQPVAPTAGWTKEQSIAWWTERGLPVDAKPRPCGYCGREYLRPCSDGEHANCANFLNKKAAP